MSPRRLVWMGAALAVYLHPAPWVASAAAAGSADAQLHAPRTWADLLAARAALREARAGWVRARWSGTLADLRRAQARLDLASERYSSILKSASPPRALPTAAAASWVPVAMDLAEVGEWTKADQLLRGSLASERSLIALRAQVVGRLESAKAGLAALGWPPDRPGRADGPGRSGRGGTWTAMGRSRAGGDEAELFVAATLSDSADLHRAGRAARWRLLEEGRPLTARVWARTSLAGALAAQGETLLARAILSREPSRSTQETLLLADLTAASGDTAGASRLLIAAAARGDLATADRYACAKRAGGWALGAGADSLKESDWLSLMRSLADVGEAALALKVMDARRVKPADAAAATEREALHAFLLIKARRYEAASGAYHALLKRDEASARERAEYALGLARAARGLRDFVATDTAFALAASLDSSGATGETAAWERAREWEDGKAPQAAASIIEWARLRIRTPSLAAAARVHEAIAWIRADSLPAAGATLSGPGPEESDVWFWRGWLARAAGDSARARAAFRRAWEVDPWSYEGVRARELVGLPVDATQGVSDARARRVARLAAAPPPTARLLELVGFHDLALEQLRSCAMGDPEPTADGCVDALEERGVFRIGRGDLELDLRLRFPPAFAGAVFRAADEEGLSPSFIWAIMRRESGYNPAARSRAGALGLLQIMVPTASRLAGRPVPEDSLADAGLNVRLGARYLHQLVREFGDWRAASAAYNGGEEAVRRWLRARSEIDDLWVELIPFRETREYVKQTYAAMRRYESVYEAVPSH